MIPYLLHASVLIAGSYLIYSFLIKTETFFKLNRWVIILTLALSLAAPLITIPSQWSLRPTQVAKSTLTIENLNQPSVNTLPGDNAETIISNESAKYSETASANGEQISPISNFLSESIFANKIWWIIYFIGAIIFIITFLVQLIIIIARMTILQSFRDGKYRIVELNKDQAPFSFWTSIFINPAKYDEETFKQIIEHEKIHIDQSHFIDKLFGEFLVIVFWFNPFAWLARTAISNNLEYLTDQSMLDKGAQRDKYQLSLLKVSVPQHPLYLTTNFNQSFLKNRIAMMNSKKSSARSTWKYLFIVPFFGISMLSLNAVEPNYKEIDSPEVSFEDSTSKITTANDEENIQNKETNQIKKENTPESIPCCDDLEESEQIAQDKVLQIRDILIDEFYKDGITKSKKDVVFLEYLMGEIRINKKQIEGASFDKYSLLLNQYGLDPSLDRLYDTKPIVFLTGKFTDHKVQQDLNDQSNPFFPVSSADTDGSSRELLKELQKELMRDNFIDSKDEEVLIELLPESIVINNHKLSSALDQKYRNIFEDYHLEGDTDGIRIIVPITILSGSMVKENHSFHYSNEEDSPSSYFSDDDYYELEETSDLGTYRRLLIHKKTLLSQNQISQSASYWKLPAFQKELSVLLIEQQSISNDKMIHLALLNDDVAVNGKLLKNTQISQLQQLFGKFNIPFVEGFRFLTNGDHVATLDPVPSIDDLKLDVIDHLYTKDLIDSKNEEIILEISGYRMKLNETRLSDNEMSPILKILMKHNVIPAPGKVIQINRKKNIVMHVGYQTDKNYIGIMEFK